MKKKKMILLSCLAMTIMFTSCANKEVNLANTSTETVANTNIQTDSITKPKIAITNPNYVNYADKSQIKFDIEIVGEQAAKYYQKYISYIAPNGKPIYIVAQDKIKNEQLLYAHSILSYYLDTLENGGHKGIGNKLANDKAFLVMPNGADGDGTTSEDVVIQQPQYQNETANVGSKWYIDNDYSHRDSAFEEIFHLVHMQGIGISAKKGADPELTEQIKVAMTNALPKDKADWGKKGLWGLNAKESLMEWDQEKGSLEAEYIICVIDTYYGMWNAFDGNGALFGEYIAKTREELKEKDPQGFALIESIFPTHITSMMRVDPSFKGEFKISLDPNNKYTFKSQYLKNISLTGTNNTNILGNDEDNIFIGNTGNNKIDGKSGKNIVQFSGESTQYNILKQNDKIIITDNIEKRDGKDELKNISILRFSDKDIETDTI